MTTEPPTPDDPRSVDDLLAADDLLSADDLAGPDDLDGHTIEQLSDYLDSGRTPRDPSIESSPGCLIALESLERLRSSAWAMLEEDAASSADGDTAWLSRVMGSISREARRGRDIPIAAAPAAPPSPAVSLVSLSVTEGSVRGLIRSAADGVGGAVVGRCTLRGDVTVPGEPITVEIAADVAWGENLTDVAHEMRDRIRAALALHTELVLAEINVTIQDIHFPSPQHPPATGDAS
jgi:uncharacterized alkaline shock family protein YloU